MFQAIERECKTASGYASVRSVETSPADKRNDMPSYFLAETYVFVPLHHAMISEIMLQAQIPLSSVP